MGAEAELCTVSNVELAIHIFVSSCSEWGIEGAEPSCAYEKVSIGNEERKGNAVELTILPS